MPGAINKAEHKLELADIFNEHADGYIQKYRPTVNQMKVISAIRACRTKTLGSQSYVCTDCGNILHLYNSCRNRHCPKCQYNAREKWLGNRKKELLPVKYFHLVFTVPSGLHEIALFNNKLFYEVLFSAVNHTLSVFADDAKWLGAKYGAIAILHTWGQNLSFHPHIHVLIPAGGISEDGMEWMDTRKNYFAPVKAMSVIFRNQFCKLLSSKLDGYETDKFSDQIKRFKDIIEKEGKKSWVVFAQKAFEKPQYVIDYLGNYTHRVAISNGRLIKSENGFVHFHYKDYRQDGKQKVMELPVLEFIRRFLQHVLPFRFCKIRYFGFLANRFKNRNLSIARENLETQNGTNNVLCQNIEELLSETRLPTDIVLHRCPCCQGKLIPMNLINETDRKAQENSS